MLVELLIDLNYNLIWKFYSSYMNLNRIEYTTFLSILRASDNNSLETVLIFWFKDLVQYHFMLLGKENKI